MFNAVFLRNALKKFKGKKQYSYKRLKESGINDPRLESIIESLPKHGETYKKYPQPDYTGKGYRRKFNKKRKKRRKRRKKSKCRQ